MGRLLALHFFLFAYVFLKHLLSAELFFLPRFLNDIGLKNALSSSLRLDSFFISRHCSYIVQPSDFASKIIKTAFSRL